MNISWKRDPSPEEDRIAELEAALAVQRELRRTDNAAGAKLDGELRAALAERDELLAMLESGGVRIVSDGGSFTLAEFRQRLADLHSSVVTPDPCDNCEWHAPDADQGPCTTDDPREYPEDCPRAKEGSEE